MAERDPFIYQLLGVLFMVFVGGFINGIIFVTLILIFTISSALSINARVALTGGSFIVLVVLGAFLIGFIFKVLKKKMGMYRV